MRTRHVPLIISAAVAAFGIALGSPRAWSAPPSFQGLGDLPGGAFYSVANVVSADGSVVVGWGSNASASGQEAFHWTRAGGMQPLGYLSPGDKSSNANGISGDGSTIVGYSSNPDKKLNEPFRWTVGGAMEGLGHLLAEPPGGDFHNRASGVSFDGSVVVGWSNSAAGESEASRWTSTEGMQGLGHLGPWPGGPFYSYAAGVSADGSVIVGGSSSRSSDPSFEAFRWTSSSGMQPLGGLIDENSWSVANAVSADGSTIVGSRSGEYFRWTSDGGFQDLGIFQPGEWGSQIAVSGDGSIVVGWARGGEAVIAFIWDATHGDRNLQEVLTSDYGLDLTGWKLSSANAISADGRTIVGDGTNPAGQSEAWLATIPEPSSLALLIVGGIFVSLPRRRRRSRSEVSDHVMRSC